MSHSRLLRRAAVLAATVALTAAAAAQATGDRDRDRERTASRTLYATTSQNLLVSFDARSPDRLRDVQTISGLPTNVTLAGIDFRPLTGDLYGVGSDSIVYRVNPTTGIAISEGPAFAPALLGRRFGVDFNPTVDKIRVVSDQRQNLRLNVDEGTLLSADKDLNPGMPTVVGAAYANSSFSATKPLATQLFVVDSATDRVFLQNPPNDGTLANGRRLGVDVGDDTGWDIAGDDNVGYLATRSPGDRGSRLYTVDPATGRTKSLGRIGGRRTVITGLAAWQD
jgi:Domain of unknown function (DUF4394)